MPITQDVSFNADVPVRGEAPAVFATKANAAWVELKRVFDEDLHNFSTQANALETNVNTKEQSVVVASNLAQQAALSAQGSANYQGLWISKGYTLGQTVSDNNGVRWLCKLTHTTAQTASEGTYWTIAIPYVGAIGNINSPLLDLPLKNSLTMKAGVGSVTFTRGSTATYIDRYGLLKTAAIDEPRFEKEGYLNEGSSTNLLPYSEQFDNAVWAKGTAVVTANTTETLDPYGTNLADKYVANAGNIAWLDQTISTLTANTTYTLSTFIKPTTTGMSTVLSFYSVETGDLYAKFDFDTKTFTGHAVNATKYGYKELSNGWFRLYLTITTGATVTSAWLQPARYTVTSDGVKGYYVFGAQLEALPFASSYIPTVASTVTRASTVCAITAANNMPSIKKGMTFICDYYAEGLTPNAYNDLLGAIYSNNEYFIFSVFGTESYCLRILSNGVQYLAVIPKTMQPKTKNRVAFIVHETGLVEVFENGVYVGNANMGVLERHPIMPINMYIGGYFETVTTFNGFIPYTRLYDYPMSTQEVALA